MGDRFCENLKEARINSGLSQKEVAEQLGVAKSTYSLYESGRREPDVERIKKLAQIIGVSSDALLGLPESPITIAAHHEGNDFTSEEWEEIERFKMFVKSKRGQ